MIELISEERCVACDICVKVCPANVFDPVPNSAPIIARQDDCQTCFMCEVYCPFDALYVAPEAERPPARAAVPPEEQILLGSYAKATGWRRGKPKGTATDPTFRLGSFI